MVFAVTGVNVNIYIFAVTSVCECEYLYTCVYIFLQSSMRVSR